MQRQRGWQHLVGDAEPALEAVVGFLEHAEAVCLLVCALDARLPQLARVVFSHPHMLLLGDETKKHASVLHCAAAHGQVAVVQWVLRHRSMWLAHGGATTATITCTSVRPFVVSDLPQTARRSHRVASAMAWVNRNVPYVFPAEVMYEAARQGDALVVSWLHTTCQYATHRAMEFAATRGHLEIAQWLYDHRNSTLLESPVKCVVHMAVPLSTSAADVMNWTAVFVKRKCFREAFATREGLFGSYDQRDDGLNWESDYGGPLAAHFASRRFKAIDFAATRGDLQLIKKLHVDKQWPCSAQAMDGAARMGHLDVVRWLHTHRTEGCTSNAIAAAAGNGHFAVVQWLHAHRFEGCRSYAMDVTATHGHLQILQWLYAEYPRFTCTQPFLPCAAANNHQHVLRWLHEEKGFAFDVRTLEVAIAGGHFGLVQWLIEQEPVLVAQLTPLAVANAAKSGNSELTQWLVTERQLWSSRALTSAARTANLTLVQWLYAYGGGEGTGKRNDPVDADTLFDLAHKGEFVLVEWLLSHQLAEPKFSQSQKELAVLIGNGARQPTNCNRTSTSTSYTSTDFAWDLHTKENPSWVGKYAFLVLKYRPTFLLSVNSSPMLAAQRGVTEVLQRLAAGGHPEVYTKQTFRALMTYTKAGDAVQWFLKATRFAFMDASVVEWAAKFQLVGLLECCMAQMETMEERFRAHACETVLRTACRHGHIELLRWGAIKYDGVTTGSGQEKEASATSRSKDKRALKANLWRELSVDAAANGHVGVLEWLCNNSERGSSQRARECQQLADVAAEHGHMHVLQWLATATASETFCVGREGVELAIANKHVDVVQWLVAEHQDDLVAKLDKRLQEAIAACLENELEGFEASGSVYVLPPV